MIELYPIALEGQPPSTEPSVVCDTPAKAVSALDELGLCMNWATLVRSKGKTLVVYQGWMYPESFERTVSLPFSVRIGDFAAQFKLLLEEMFRPHLKDTMVHRSRIDVYQNSADPRSFNVDMFLLFDSSVADEISETLGRVEDSHEDATTRIFILD